MTAPDIDALDALLEKATPGPFYWFMRECATKEALMVELAAVVDKTVAVNGYNLHGVGVGDPDPDADYLAVAHTGCGPRSPINAQLIVAAVNALPGLLARVRELEQDAARLEWFAHECRLRDSSIRLADGTFKTCTAWAIASADEDLRAVIDAARKVQP